MTQIGSAYGQALYTLAKDEGVSEEILKDLRVMKESFEAEPNYLVLLAAANISVEERCQIVETAFRERVHPYVLNFLKILTEKGYARHFEECFLSYEEQYNLDNNILPIKVVSAIPLSEKQTEKLITKLSNITGKNIQLTKEVSAECVGGVRLDFAGKRIDDTVRNRLNNINNLLQKTVL